MNTFSNVIAGCMSWGKWGKNLSTSEIQTLINYCIEIGISTFDHADIYGDYSTESDFGKAMKDMSLNRSDFELISKCGIQNVGNARSNKIKHYNYSKEYILWSVDKSLKDLNSEYLDLLLLHRPSPLLEVDEVAQAFDKLKSNGKVKAFGVSNFTASQIDLLKTETTIDYNQIESSITHLNPFFDGTLDYMRTHQIGVMAWSPLGKVFKEKSDRNDRLMAIIKRLKETYNASEDQLILAWLMQHPAYITPVVGTTNKDRLKNALAAKDIKLDIEDWFSLLVASQGHKVP